MPAINDIYCYVCKFNYINVQNIYYQQKEQKLQLNTLINYNHINSIIQRPWNLMRRNILSIIFKLLMIAAEYEWEIGYFISN